MRPSRLLTGVVALSLLGACGTHRTGAPPTSTGSATTTSTTSSTPAPPPVALAPEVRQAYDAAAARYPHLDPEVCTYATPLTDRTCGAALAAMNDVAATTAQTLTALNDPVHQPVLSTAAEVGDTYGTLLDPIPCFGLSDAPAPPPPLEVEAQGICAEGADIMKGYWNIFLTQVSLLGDP